MLKLKPRFTPADIPAAEGRCALALAEHLKAPPQGVGSTYTSPAGGLDIDVLVLVDDLWAATQTAVQRGFTYTGGDSCEDEDEFHTLREGPINLILTGDKVFYDAFLTAAEVCKFLGLPEKWQRVGVHRIIMNDGTADSAVSFVENLGLKR